MHTTLMEAEAEFRQWLTTDRAEGRQSATTVGGLDEETRERWAAENRNALTYQVFVALIDDAVRGLDRGPKATESLTSFIVQHIEHVSVPPGAEIAHLLLEVNAWRERGNALRNVGDLPGAAAAYQRALELASPDPFLASEAAIMRRGLALLQHYRGESLEALRIIRADIPIFDAVDDIPNVLRSRFFEGAIEYEIGHDDIAREIFLETLALSRQLGDPVTEARSLTNAGHAARRLGERDEAFRLLTLGLEHLQRCGMTAEVPRAEWGLALLADGADLLITLERIRNQFVDSGRPIDAAWVSLDTVALLLDTQRPAEAATLAAELVEFFATLNLPRESMEALNELRDAAMDGELTGGFVEEITRKFGLGRM
jgi:tetratricopeptide (TPR) repeat protein